MRQFCFIAFVFASVLLVASRAEAVIQGIDVSHHQGTINWTTVKNAGLQFAFTKATEGVDFEDDKFDINMAGAIAAGVPIGPYHFARVNSGETIPTDAIDEADDFIAAIRPYYATSPGIILRPVLDLENIPDDPVSPSIKAYTSKWTSDFCNRVQSVLGFAPIIYSNGNFAINYLDGNNPYNIDQYPLWFAKPTNTNDYNAASVPTAANMGIWGSVGWKFWQWSWVGNIGGISPVDRDAFDGTLLQLAQQFSPTYSNGDYNNNGVVDTADYVLWRKTLGQTVKLGWGADGDLSGVIDAGDFSIWKTNYGKLVPNVSASGAGGGLDAVPEPASIILAVAVLMAMATVRRQR